MIEGSIAFKIEAKELLSFKEVDEYLSTAKKITEEFLATSSEIISPELQPIALPTSHDQPENFPFVVVQGEGVQLTVSRREVVFTFSINEPVAIEDIAGISQKQKNSLFNAELGVIIDRDNIRIVEAQFNNYIQKNSYTDMLQYLNQKNILKDSFIADDTGFAVRYSETSSLGWMTHFRREYLSSVNTEKKLLAIQASCAMILGGYSFNNFKFEDIDTTKVDKFLKEYNENAITTLLTDFYGSEE